MRIWLAILSGALLLTAVACGSNNTAKRTTTGTNTGTGGNTGSMPMSAATEVAVSPVATGAAATSVPHATTVIVTLDEYAVNLDRASVPAGPVHFVVKNSGQRGHQFQVYPTGMVTNGSAGHAMPTMTGGTMVGAVGFLQLVPAGASQVLDVTLPAGRWELACHLQDSEHGTPFDHYDKGMKATLTVGT